MTKPHNPNCAIVRQGNTRAWCDCGVDNQTPPDWVLIEAAERSNFAYSLNFIANNYGTMSHCYRALCDMIAKHEQPPVDRKLLCAREALRLGNEGAFRDGNGNWTPEQEMVRAIELWESGYGKD